MIRLVILLNFLHCALSAVVYIDRSSLDFNKNVGNWSTEFTHNEKHNCIVNLTMNSYKRILKMLVYMRVNFAENEDDHEFKRQFLRTVFDAEKGLKEAQKNFIVLSFMKNFKKYADFDFNFPFHPVSFEYQLNKSAL